MQSHDKFGLRFFVGTALAAGLFLAFAMSACSPVNFTTSPKVSYNGNPNFVCDPFGNNSSSNSSTGLKGKLRYLNADQPRYSYTYEYVQNGQTARADIFLSQLYVPTRPFSSGFLLPNGSALSDDNGNMLIEYFSLSLESLLRLNPTRLSAASSGATPPGDYQFAILSDDGATMRIDTGSGYSTLIDDDNIHPTKLKCANTPVHMDASSKLPMQLDYFQGPRYHISLILMFRPWTVNAYDDLCQAEESGNALYFDSTQNPPAPQPRWTELMNRGWRPLEPDNFLVPGGVNPCSI